MYGRNKERARAILWLKVGGCADEFERCRGNVLLFWYASAATVTSGGSRAVVGSDSEAEIVITSSVVGLSRGGPALFVCCKGSSGRTIKKDRSIITGSMADTMSVVLTLRPRVDVKSTYSPAPASPAPPVPLPHAARL